MEKTGRRVRAAVERWTEGHNEQALAIAQSLVQKKVEVIALATGTLQRRRAAEDIVDDGERHVVSMSWWSM